MIILVAEPDLRRRIDKERHGRIDAPAFERSEIAEPIASFVHQVQAGIAAAIAILDRGFGRPHQTSEIVTVQKPVSEMSDEELIARIREFDEDGGTPSH